MVSAGFALGGRDRLRIPLVEQSDHGIDVELLLVGRGLAPRPRGDAWSGSVFLLFLGRGRLIGLGRRNFRLLRRRSRGLWLRGRLFGWGFGFRGFLDGRRDIGHIGNRDQIDRHDGRGFFGLLDRMRPGNGGSHNHHRV